MDLLLDGLERDGPALLALDEALVRAGPDRPILRPGVNPPAAEVMVRKVASEVHAPVPGAIHLTVHEDDIVRQSSVIATIS